MSTQWIRMINKLKTKPSILILLTLTIIPLITKNRIISKVVATKPPKWHELTSSSYTFSSYIKDFNRSYSNQKEWIYRKEIFYNNVKNIIEHNNNNKKKKSYYKKGINHFTDLRNDEIPTGLIRDTNNDPASLKWNNRNIVVDDDDDDVIANLPFELSDVSELPQEVDWRIEGVVSPVKDQGHCGSCWAFSSTSILESHIALQTGYLFTFSPQELVSCVPNPNHCGGDGGCSGSTNEIAYDFISNHGGIVLEDHYGYDSGRTGNSGVCLITNKTSSNSTSLDIIGGVASIKNYTILPTNNHTVLMNAIAKYGPVSVSVAASTWAGYESGILRYDDTPDNNTNKFIVNHAVNLIGYGTDIETGMDYWLVRNSWSPLWGENGYIRLERVDPATLPNPKLQCGMDNYTSSGSACIDANGTVTPSQIEVCGTSAILSESTIPIGGYLIDKNYHHKSSLSLETS